MYVRTSGPDVTAIEVTCYPFSGRFAASVEFTGRSEVVLHSLADADRLIIAAANAKRRLEAAIAGTAHEFRDALDARGNCDACGLLSTAPAHDAPEAARQALLTLACSHTFTGPVTGVKIAYCAACDRGEPIVRIDGEDAPCPASHPLDGMRCEVKGPHGEHAYVTFPDGLRVAWTDADTLAHAIDTGQPVIDEDVADGQARTLVGTPVNPASVTR